jgi:hypothetical protein
MTWAAWSGQRLNRPAAPATFGTPAQQYSGTGTVIALDPLDLGLSSLDAPKIFHGCKNIMISAF